MCATYRWGGGSREQGQDPTTRYDDVINHLRNEVDGVVDKYNVLVTVYEVHDRFRRVAERKTEQRKTAVRQDHVKSTQCSSFQHFTIK